MLSQAHTHTLGTFHVACVLSHISNSVHSVFSCVCVCEHVAALHVFSIYAKTCAGGHDFCFTAACAGNICVLAIVVAITKYTKCAAHCKSPVCRVLVPAWHTHPPCAVETALHKTYFQTDVYMHGNLWSANTCWSKCVCCSLHVSSAVTHS
jgi:hypothetical protein